MATDTRFISLDRLQSEAIGNLFGFRLAVEGVEGREVRRPFPLLYFRLMALCTRLGAYDFGRIGGRRTKRRLVGRERHTRANETRVQAYDPELRHPLNSDDRAMHLTLAARPAR
jgi:hypothetical protein